MLTGVKSKKSDSSDSSLIIMSGSPQTTHSMFPLASTRSVASESPRSNSIR